MLFRQFEIDDEKLHQSINKAASAILFFSRIDFLLLHERAARS